MVTAAPAPGIAPNPKRGNAADWVGPVVVDEAADFDELPFVAAASVALSPISFACFSASASFLAFSSSSSRFLSYPSCLTRSASSSAFRSASAKSTGFVFDAPSPSFDFFAAVDVEDVAEDEAEFSREVPPPIFPGRTAEEDVVVRGGMELDVAGARPMIGGVETLGVPGAEPLGVDDLDHESKKSSPIESC